MGSYEWMELQTLTSEIATSRSRLAAARKSKDHGRVRALEEEIAAAEGRRERLLAHITSNLVGGPEGTAAAASGAAATAAAKETSAPAKAAAATEKAAPDPPEETAPEVADAEQPLDLVEPIAAGGVEPVAAAAKADGGEGGITVWDQLTPNDIERARNELVSRRAEILARHAEELKGLEADQAQLETLEQAIANFARKFNLAPGDGDVVKLDKERELRQQGA